MRNCICILHACTCVDDYVCIYVDTYALVLQHVLKFMCRDAYTKYVQTYIYTYVSLDMYWNLCTEGHMLSMYIYTSMEFEYSYEWKHIVTEVFLSIE